jgi:hypothetical protein
MRDETAIALLIVLVIASAGAGYYIGSSSESTTTSVLTTTITAVPIQNTSISCIQTGIHGSLFVRVVLDNTDRPVVGDNVTVTILNYCNNSEHRIPLGYTNYTGYTSSPADWTGVMLVNVTNVFSKASYMFLAQTSGAVSLATLSLPSGLTVVKPIACYGAFPAACGNTTVTETAVG